MVKYLLIIILAGTTITVLYFSPQILKKYSKDPGVNIIIERPDLLTRIKNTPYKRFVLLKGNDLSDVEKALTVRAEIYNMRWKVKEAQYKEYTLLQILEWDTDEVTDFHHLATWFLGPNNQPIQDYINSSDLGIVIAIDTSGKSTYLAYVNKQILDNSEETCDMYGVFQNNDKAIFSACFDMVRSSKGREIQDFQQALNTFGINLNEIQNESLQGKVYTVQSKDYKLNNSQK